MFWVYLLNMEDMYIYPFLSVSAHALEINQTLWAGHVPWTPSPSASFSQCKCKFAPFCDCHCDCGGLRTLDPGLWALDSELELRPWWSAGMTSGGQLKPLAIVDISTFDHRPADKDTHICSCHGHRRKLGACSMVHAAWSIEHAACGPGCHSCPMPLLRPLQVLQS